MPPFGLIAGGIVLKALSCWLRFTQTQDSDSDADADAGAGGSAGDDADEDAGQVSEGWDPHKKLL